MDLAPLLCPPDDQDEPFVPDFSEGAESGLYLALFELLDEGLLIASDETVLAANRAACRLLERSYGELVGRPLAEIFPSEQAFLTARARMFIQGQMRGSLQIALPGGRHRDMRFCAAARLRPGLHALVLAPDYLAEAGAPARVADPLWPRLAAALEQPVIVVDGDSRMAAANAAALRRLKLPRTGLVGRRLDEYLEVGWPAPGTEPLARLRPANGEALAARLLPGPKPGWRLLILPAQGPAAARPAEPAPHSYADDMNTRNLERRALEANLGQAIPRRELELHFVPEWRTSAPLAAQALLRWRHPDLGLIAGRQLAALLRPSERLKEVGAWTLAQACGQAAAWAAQGRGPTVVVGVTLEQLADPAFPALVGRVLADTGLTPERLELDLEEAVLAHDDDRLVAAAGQLAGLGVSLAIDDFGEGLASLRRLGRLPLTRLRLAPSFIQESLTAPAVLEATLAMARSLGLAVVAKGVDSAAARARLLDMGFAALQGRAIGDPLDASSFARLHLG